MKKINKITTYLLKQQALLIVILILFTIGLFFITLQIKPARNVVSEVSAQVCSFSKANCSWSPAPDATSYKVTVKEEVTGNIVYDQIVPAATTKIIFDVSQDSAYQCDVAAVNSCGQAGPIGSHSLFCAAGGVVLAPSATPTPLPTSQPGTPTPTQTAVATATPRPPTATPIIITRAPTIVVVAPTRTPTIAPPGPGGNILQIGISGIVVLLIGIAAFVLVH